VEQGPGGVRVALDRRRGKGGVACWPFLGGRGDPIVRLPSGGNKGKVGGQDFKPKLNNKMRGKEERKLQLPKKEKKN